MRERLGLFRLAGRGYAIPLERLLRVVDEGLAAPLPLAPAEMAGMLIVDDEVVPLLDSGWLSGAPTGCGAEAAYRVLVATEYGPLAFPADLTVGIVSAAKGEPLPLDPGAADYLTEGFGYRGEKYQVLDVDLFLVSLIRS